MKKIILAAIAASVLAACAPETEAPADSNTVAGSGGPKEKEENVQQK